MAGSVRCSRPTRIVLVTKRGEYLGRVASPDDQIASQLSVPCFQLANPTHHQRSLSTANVFQNVGVVDVNRKERVIPCGDRKPKIVSCSEIALMPE